MSSVSEYGLWTRFQAWLIRRWIRHVAFQPGDVLLVYDPDLMLALSKVAANPAELRLAPFINNPYSIPIVYVERDRTLFSQLDFRTITELYNEAYAMHARGEWERAKTAVNSSSTSEPLAASEEAPALTPKGQRAKRT